MKVYEIQYQNAILASQVCLADSFGTRLKGLMFRKSLEPGEGLLLKDCSDIHCCFMRFPIDAVYLDTQMTVVGKQTLPPWRLGKHFPGAKHVLELNAGCAAELPLGACLTVKEMEYHE